MSLTISDGLGQQSSLPAPTVSGLSPASGGTIPTSQVISFNVTDFDVLGNPVAFDLIFVKVVFPNVGESDVVYDEDGFGPQYSNGSTSITAISGGYHFTILRTGGWIDTVVDLVVSAINTTGAEL
jgi:hypothetical protein